jgi:Family of unknown function (DUF6152)
MQRRQLILGGTGALLVPSAFAHHGWSSFDQDRPIYLEGKAVKVTWGNPHAEVDLQIPADLKLPPDLAKRALPAQSANVDGPRLLAAARLPTRRDPVWEIEFAPLTRMEAWKVPQIKVGDTIAVLGFTLVGEKGEAVLRAEYLFAGGQTYGMRSAPA